MSANEGDNGVSTTTNAASSRDISMLGTEGGAFSSESNGPSLESQLIRQIQIRDSLVLKELAQKAQSEFDERENVSFTTDSEITADVRSKSDINLRRSGPSIEALHSEAFDLSGLEFRSRSMVRIASQRQLIQEVMLTNISEDKQDPLLSSARRLMQERDTRVKDLTNQLRALNEIKDRVETIRKQRAVLAIENRSLAQRNALASQHCAQTGSADHPMTDTPADSTSPDPEFWNESGSLAGATGAGLLEEISLETSRHVKIRSIFSSLVGWP
jgi:hypothetical protein